VIGKVIQNTEIGVPFTLVIRYYSSRTSKSTNHLTTIRRVTLFMQRYGRGPLCSFALAMLSFCIRIHDPSVTKAQLYHCATVCNLNLHMQEAVFGCKLMIKISSRHYFIIVLGLTLK